MQFSPLNQAVLSAALIALCACSPTTLKAGHTLTGQDDAGRASRPGVLKSESNASPVGPEHVAAAPSEQAPPRSLVPAVQLESGGKVIGQPGRIALEGASPSAHWIAYCQSTTDSEAPIANQRTQGDRSHLFLNLLGQDLAVEAVLRWDPSGQFIVVLIDGVAWLVDAVRDARWDLSLFNPDLRFDGIAEHRSFAFTAGALLILTKSEDAENSQLVGIDLSGLEKDHAISSVNFAVKDQVVYRLEAEDNHVWTVSLPKGSTTRYWPAQFRTKATRRCDAQQKFNAFARLSAFKPDPYIRYSWSYLPHINASQPLPVFTDAPGFVFGFAKGWVRRLDTGRLMFVEGTVQKQITTARCGARVLHADEATGQFLIACEEYEPGAAPSPPPKSQKVSIPKYRFDLYLIKPGRVLSLKVDTARTGVDVRGQQGLRFVPIRPGAQSAVVDLKRAKLFAFDGDAQVLTTGPAGALIRRGNKLSLWHFDQTVEDVLDYQLTNLSSVLVRGSLVAVGARIFDLRQTFRSWLLPGEPIELTTSGHALIPAWRSGSEQIDQGPYMLLPPEAAPSESIKR